jgi:integrase/recombinase XerD
LPVTLTPEEAEALLATVNSACTTGLRNRTMLQVMLGAGLRVSEVVALRGTDVDLQKGTVRVNLGKGGKGRVVPVDGSTLQWLQAWAGKRKELGLNGRHAFFPGIREGATGRGDREHGQALTTRYLQGLVPTLAAAAGIEKRVSPHTLRHTYATGLLDRGFNIREVQELLGHANVQTTQVYTHVNPEELRAKVQAAGDPAPTVDPQVQALAAALANLTQEQRQALGALLGVAG